MSRRTARLRIVGGSFGGRTISVPVDEGSVRPTSERLREAIASALEARGAIAGRRVLDLFAGSGALAFEALSRGAASASLVEHDRMVARAIESSARALGVEPRVSVLLADLLDPAKQPIAALRAAGAEPFDLVLCDPPYARVAELSGLFARLLEAGVVAAGGLVVVEHPSNVAPPSLADLVVERTYRHGSSAATLYSVRDR